MSEQMPVGEPSLSDLTGRTIDTDEYLRRISPQLEKKGLSLEEFGRRELNLRTDIIAKVIRYGERTPAAPYLGEISSRLGRAVYFEGQTTLNELAELLAHFRHEVEEAEDYFNG